MPRCARVKTPVSIFHIMVRSISEVKLFKTIEDKCKYMFFIKKYQHLYHFKVYAYCLMDNHAHFIIDANGADISKIMHSINFSYAVYFNRIHKRNGHLFQDRFKSKVVTSQRYLYTLSAYIHNNPSDLPEYKNSPEKYGFSSLSMYINSRKDPFNILDIDYINKYIRDKLNNSNKNYLDFLRENSGDIKCRDEVEFSKDPTRYISSRHPLIRKFKKDWMINFISEKTNVDTQILHAKYLRSSVNSRALLTLFMRSFCDLKCSDICKILGNITQSRVSSLSRMGLELVVNEEKYKNILQEFFNKYA